ncbi:MAG TPA: hypothetical protein DEO88_01665, partial [Syntrophobacteraceae bacterium]|nr:hypothetical protein [Syntrophobacteraceae bacterium]
MGIKEGAWCQFALQVVKLGYGAGIMAVHWRGPQCLLAKLRAVGVRQRKPPGAIDALQITASTTKGTKIRMKRNPIPLLLFVFFVVQENLRMRSLMALSPLSQ